LFVIVLDLLIILIRLKNVAKLNVPTNLKTTACEPSFKLGLNSWMVEGNDSYHVQG